MRAMVLEAPGAPAPDRAAGPPAATGRGAPRGRGVRAVSDRPAHRRRGARRAQAAARARTSDRRPARGGGVALCRRPAGRGAVARYLRRMPLLSLGAGESLRARPLHGLRGFDGGYAQLAVADERFCLALLDGLPGPGGRAAARAGLIGYRALQRAGAADRLGLHGRAPPPTSSARWPTARAEGCSPSPAPTTRRPSASRSRLPAWAGHAPGPAPESSTPR